MEQANRKRCQVEMTGSSVFDYIHHQDHSELAEQLGLGLASAPGSSSGLASPGGSAGSGGDEASGTLNPDVTTLMTLTNATYKGIERAFCIRMKSTLTKRGCHFKSSGYRVVLVLCRLRGQYSSIQQARGAKTATPPTIMGMVALAIALPPPSVHEIRLETDMVSDILDYTAEELTGRNMYSLCHGEDANKLRKCHVD
ncbi:hypothetical protein B566_EDAN011812, partial [Ephemera danica]